MRLAIHDSLFQTCLERIAPYRKEKPKGAIAEGYVGLILDSCAGQLDREPDFSGKRPDYEWTVKPELPGSFRFIVEVVYLGNSERVRTEIYLCSGRLCTIKGLVRKGAKWSCNRCRYGIPRFDIPRIGGGM